MDYTVSDLYKNIYNNRHELDASGNPLQAIYKLLMNSSYSKTIQRPIEEETAYKYDEEADKFWSKNYNISESDSILYESRIHQFKVCKA